MKIAEANSQVTGLQTDSEAIKRQCGEHRTSLAKYQGEMQATEALLGDCRAFLNDHRADADLGEALTGIGQQIKTLTSLDLRLAECRTKLAEHVLQRTVHGAGAATGGNQLGREPHRQWQRRKTGYRC